METPIKLKEDKQEDWEHDSQQIALAKSLSGRAPTPFASL